MATPALTDSSSNASGERTSPTGDTVESRSVIDIPNNLNARVAFIVQEKKNCVSMIVAKTQRAKRTDVDRSVEEIKVLLARLDHFLTWLATEVEITPELKKRSLLDQILGLVFAHPTITFPQEYAARAQQLHHDWSSRNWGQGEVVDEDSQDEGGNEGQPADSSRRSRSDSTVTTSRDQLAFAAISLRIPPTHHPIFGEDGIMYGVAMKRGPRRTLVKRPDFEGCNCKVFGNNGLQIGAWWPKQFLALLNGAHGSKQGGIAGNVQTGAYSIVVSGLYDELDRDEGDTVYYSGSNSHDNTDPREPFPSSNATQALKTSFQIGKAVRLLRSSKGKNHICPTEGIRYDGLYRVTALNRNKRNTKGGVYEQFRLEREVGQESLESISRRSPSAQEIADYRRIDDDY